MIVIGAKAGQMGNRMLLMAHFMANAIENNYAIINPTFDEYSGLFDTTSHDLWCRFPTANSSAGNSAFLRHTLYQICRVTFKAASFLPANRSIKVFVRDISEPELDLASPEFTA